jgi:hypothetical protein
MDFRNSVRKQKARCGDYVAIRGTRQVVYEIGLKNPNGVTALASDIFLGHIRRGGNSPWPILPGS